MLQVVLKLENDTYTINARIAMMQHTLPLYDYAQAANDEQHFLMCMRCPDTMCEANSHTI